MPSRTEVLILGANGMLGSACMRAFGPDAVGRDLEDFDLSKHEETLAAIKALRPRLVINCAAATDVDRCETDHEYADNGNWLAAKHAAEAASETGARLVHISTDFVFAGDKGVAYTEIDQPDPISYYGASKLAGEQAVELTCPDALIVRTSWMYGHGGDHFPGKVREWAAGGGPLRVVDDQRGSPTYADDLAKGLKSLVERNASGLFHLGGSGCANRLQWARETLTLSGLQVEVLPAATTDFPLPASRPANSCLDCSKAASLGVELPPWQDALTRYVRATQSAAEGAQDATLSAAQRPRDGAKGGAERAVKARAPGRTEDSMSTDVLILGAKGMLGSACLRVFGSAAVGRDLEDFDLSKRDDTRRAISELRPRLIVNCAAAAEVDRCETDRDYAYRGNILAPTHIAEAAAEVQAKLVHLSTVFVFDGEKQEPYSEDDAPRPLNYYGETKLEGEQTVSAVLPETLIVRTSWMYGQSGIHFPGKLREWVASGGPLRIVDDQVGSPTYADDLAAAIKALTEEGATDLYHLGGSGCASRIAYTQEILDLMGLGAQIVPAATADFPLPATRPLNSCLDCSKAASLGVRLPPWRDALARYVRATQDAC